MEEGLKELLQANLELSKENNKMLHKMVRTQRNALIMKAVYWLIIIGITVGAFFYIQPFLKKFTDMLPGVSKLLNSFPDFSKLINLLPR